ncbi:MAG: hypothetical protein DRQ47_10900, partial [Gammaproteobacteria bacterium]
YLLPLIFMITGALVAGTFSNNSDPYTIIGAIAGILLGFYASRKLSDHYFKDGLSTPTLVEDPQDGCWYEAD